MLVDESPPVVAAMEDQPHRASLSWAVLARLGAIYAGWRLAVAFVVLCSRWMSGGQQSLYGAFTRWDSAWYGFIAEKGYPTYLTQEAGGGNRWAFFPGWPSLLRFTHAVIGGSWQRNGTAWAVILTFAAVVLLYLLVADRFGENVGYRACLVFLVAPAAPVLAMAYSEVLFVPCCIACVLFLGRERWALAGSAALIAGATRIAGIALVVVCLIEAMAAFRRTRSWRPFFAPILAPLGLVAFFVYQRARAGTWSAYSDAQAYWGNGNSAGRPVLRAFGDLLTSAEAWDFPPNVLVPLVVLMAIGSAVALLRTAGVPRSWWVATALLGAMAMTPSLIYSIPRLFLPVFPLAAGVAAKAPARWFPALVAASAVVMTAVGVLYFNTTGFQMAP